MKGFVVFAINFTSLAVARPSSIVADPVEEKIKKAQILAEMRARAKEKTKDFLEKKPEERTLWDYINIIDGAFNFILDDSVLLHATGKKN